jgi:hypothetical protein
MLRIQMIGLALVAALFMSAVAAGSASAAHEWLINGASLGAPVKVHSLGLLLLEDSTAPGGAVKIHCHGFDAGTVGPGALDLVTSITRELLGTNDKIPCTFDKAGLCKSNVTPLALAVNLPWHTEITLINGKVRDMIMSDGNGNPGWLVLCTNIIGGESHDICTRSLISTALANVAGGVQATFDAESGNADCSLNGGELRKEVSRVTGTTLTESPSAGEPLTFM